MAGQISVPDDFDQMGREEFERIFGGGGGSYCASWGKDLKTTARELEEVFASAAEWTSVRAPLIM